MTKTRDLLRLNVGFIIHQTVGYSRDFVFDFPFIHLIPDLDLMDLTGTVRVTRTAKGLLVQAKLEAKATVECSRCLVEFEQPLEVEFTELFAFSPETATDSGLVVPETGKIDLGPLVRDEMLVAIPLSPVCTPECKGLCPICGGNLNEEQCEHEEESIDPRLEILKSLLDKKE